MRILYSHRIQSRDGQSVHLEEMVAAFRQAGHEVLVVGPGFYASSGFGAESHVIAALRRHLPAALAEMAELAYNIPAWWRLRRQASMFQPDLIYERYNLYFLAGAWLARMRKIRYFVEVNSPLAEEREAHGGLRLRRIAHGTERAVWRQADRVLAVSHVLAARIEAVGVSTARIAVTPNGVDLARFAGLPPRDPTRPPVLGFIGFVRPWHGLEAVIEAMGRHDQQLELIIAGEGPARDGLEKQAMAAGCAARVKFIGLTARDDVPLLLGRFDIALQPQSVDYASPLKLFEYMAAGCAIIAPDQPNIREIVEHGVTAWLFDPQEPGALWQAVARLAADPALRQNLGRNAAAAIITRDLTWAGNARRVVEWAKSR
jgi:glycosyltransferase involved in cell wall biosynthesis